MTTSTLFPYTTLFRSMGMPGEAGMNQEQAAKSLQQALDALNAAAMAKGEKGTQPGQNPMANAGMPPGRSEEHTSELQAQFHLVCRRLLEKKKRGCPRR